MRRTNVILQDRDLSLLRVLAEDFLILSSEQIGELFPMGSRSRINFRLKQLRDGGYLSYRPLFRIGSITLGVYYLGPEAMHVFEPGEKAAAEAAREQAMRLADAGLAHRLLVDWVHIRFRTASRNHAEFRLSTWIDQYSPWWAELQAYGVPIKADAYGEFLQLFGFGHLYTFFLEVDRGTEKGRTLQEKIDRYVEYAASGEYEQQFAARMFRVLFVTTSPGRMERLLRLMERKAGDIFWVTTWEQFKQSKLLDAYWRRPRHDGKYSLEWNL